MLKYQYPILRVLTLLALGVSTALLADHLAGASSFCGFDDPCGEVAASQFGNIFGMPLSAIGVGWFTLFFMLTLIPFQRCSNFLRVFAAITGLGGAILLTIQFAILHKVCPLCVTVDTAAVVIALVALVRRPTTAPIRWYWVAGWIWLFGAAILTPVFWSLGSRPKEAPEQVREHWAADRITVVEVSDFECPHCQRLDPILREFLRRHDVKFVRLVAPLRGFPNSRSAARAYLAAVRQGKSEEMAMALFKAELRDAASCRKIAAQLQLDLAKYDEVVADPATDREIDATADWATKDTAGLPLLWIQNQLFTGVPTLEMLEDAFARAHPPKH
ncbi:MAG TPA: vitamin K epoxide reductase family protein [Gemmataceae bacterium]|jgi:uncharacterized membrane protein/predicted DsbA family dithiol-disulfide isomerase|nr:vitamin K epoxide reductase family protein [Gemmataceae bacterium]